LNPGFWLGLSVTAVPPLLNPFGSWSASGRATSMSQRVQGVSPVHPGREPDCQQDLYDSGRGRKHTAQALFGSIGPKDIVLFQVRKYAEALYPFSTSLPQFWGGTCPSIDSYYYSATPPFECSRLPQWGHCPQS
jgi:hypothetical protein